MVVAALGVSPLFLSMFLPTALTFASAAEALAPPPTVSETEAALNLTLGPVFPGVALAAAFALGCRVAGFRAEVAGLPAGPEPAAGDRLVDPSVPTGFCGGGAAGEADALPAAGVDWLAPGFAGVAAAPVGGEDNGAAFGAGEGAVPEAAGVPAATGLTVVGAVDVTAGVGFKCPPAPPEIALVLGSDFAAGPAPGVWSWSAPTFAVAGEEKRVTGGLAVGGTEAAGVSALPAAIGLCAEPGKGGGRLRTLSPGGSGWGDAVAGTGEGSLPAAPAAAPVSVLPDPPLGVVTVILSAPLAPAGEDASGDAGRGSGFGESGSAWAGSVPAGDKAAAAALAFAFAALGFANILTGSPFFVLPFKGSWGAEFASGGGGEVKLFGSCIFAFALAWASALSSAAALPSPAAAAPAVSAVEEGRAAAFVFLGGGAGGLKPAAPGVEG